MESKPVYQIAECSGSDQAEGQRDKVHLISCGNYHQIDDNKTYNKGYPGQDIDPPGFICQEAECAPCVGAVINREKTLDDLLGLEQLHLEGYDPLYELISDDKKYHKEKVYQHIFSALISVIHIHKTALY